LSAPIHFNKEVICGKIDQQIREEWQATMTNGSIEGVKFFQELAIVSHRVFA